MRRKSRNRRILDIYLRLANGEMIYIKDEVDNFKVSSRTIKRDITEIRLALAEQYSIVTLIYVKKQNGYKLSETRTDIMTGGVILRVCKVLLQCEVFLEDELGDILKKLIKNCLSKKDQNVVWGLIENEYEKKIVCRKPFYKGKWEDLVLDLEIAVKRQKMLKITYQRIGAKKPVLFIVEPMAVLLLDGYFYLAAYMVEFEQEDFTKLQEELVLYQVDRILMAQILEKQYHIPYKKRLKEREIWKQMYGGEKMQVQLCYTGKRIEAVFDKLPLAEIVERKEGGYWIDAEVFEEEILKLVLSYGEDMKIVKPIKLRDKLKEILEQILKKYQEKE